MLCVSVLRQLSGLVREAQHVCQEIRALSKLPNEGLTILETPLAYKCRHLASVSLVLGLRTTTNLQEWLALLVYARQLDSQLRLQKAAAELLTARH